MCDNNDSKNIKGDEEMAVVNEVKIDIKQSIKNSLDEVEKIRQGKLPKKSYKETIREVRQQLSEESE